MFEDEASFQLDPTLHRTWSPRGQQPRVPTRGERKTAHVFGSISLRGAEFTFTFVEIFNGASFLAFLKLLVEKYQGTKLFLIIDNGPCHNLNVEGKEWLAQHQGDIELHRLPPYSPEFNPTEGVWKLTRKMTTHNQFFGTTTERDMALEATFRRFQHDSSLLAPQVKRFL
jgi:transposase